MELITAHIEYLYYNYDAVHAKIMDINNWYKKSYTSMQLKK